MTGTSAGTVYLDFEGRFDDFLGDVRTAGRRGSEILESSFNAGALGRALGTDLASGVGAGLDSRELGRRFSRDLGSSIDGASVGRAAGADLTAGLRSGLDPRELGRRFGHDLGASVDGDRIGRGIGSGVAGGINAGLGDTRRAGARAGDRFGDGFSDAADKSTKDMAGKVAGGLAAAWGAVQVGGLVTDALEEAREAGQVGRLTEQVITSTGAAAQVSAAHVGELAGALSRKAGVDDEVIQSGANLLLTFTKVRNEVGSGNDVFDQATGLALDMSVAMGTELRGSALLVGKALNDPIKGMTALGRAGVQLTAAQKEQIKGFVGAGDAMSAQKIILGELETQFGGAAAAATDPLDRLGVAWGNLLEGAGAKVLPWVSDVAEGIGEWLPGAVDRWSVKADEMVDRGQAVARSLWEEVKPAADDLWATLQNLGRAAVYVWESADPIVDGLTAIGGAAVLGALTGVAQVLESTSGFLADHSNLLIAGAVAWGAWKAAALGAAGWTVLSTGLQTASTSATYLLTSIQGLAATRGVSTMSAGVSVAGESIRGLASSAIVAQAAVAGVVAVGVLMFLEWQKAGRQAKQEIDDLKPEGFDDDSLRDLERYGGLLAKHWDSASEAAEGSEGFAAANAAIIDQLPVLENGMNRTIRTEREAAAAYEENRLQQQALRTAYQETWERVHDYPIDNGYWLGVNDPAWAEMEDLINRLDLDPATQTFDEMATEIRAYLTSTAEEAGYRGKQIQDAVALPPEVLEEQKAAWEELAGAVSSSWSGALDAVSGLGSFENLTGDDITGWYAMQTANAENFASNITKAFELGYDPQLVSRLLQAGPAEAAPIVQQMVDDHSANLLWAVNAGEFAMQQLNLKAVELARLTHIATTNESSAMAAELGTAMQITEAVGRMGSAATANAIAEELHIGVDKVTEVAGGYGIELAAAINPILHSVGKHGVTFGQGAVLRNAGGYIPGPDINKDIVNAKLTPGEYVLTRDMTRQVGVGNLEAWRRASRMGQGAAAPVPMFNEGGQVLLAAGRMVENAGARISEHPYWDRVDPVHVPGSYHYRNTSGTGADAWDANYGAGTSAREMAFFDQMAPKVAAMGLRVLWRVAGHFNHMHADLGQGAVGPHFPPLPQPPAIGGWPLAQGGEGSMQTAHDAASDWMSSLYSTTVLGPGGSPSAVRSMVQEMAAARGWVGREWEALDKLVQRESSWNPTADNPTSTAFGLFQFLDDTWAAYGPKTSNAALQAQYGFDYIADRYLTPTRALDFHYDHGWYNDGGPVEPVFIHRRPFDEGGVVRPGVNVIDNKTGKDEVLANVTAGAHHRAGLTVEGNLVVQDATDIDLIVQKQNAAAVMGRA